MTADWEHHFQNQQLLPQEVRDKMKDKVNAADLGASLHKYLTA